MKRELDHQENLKRDAEELGKLRDRVANFGKTELEIDRNRVLRELDDPRQRREALGHFNTLERLEQEKGRIDSLRKDRETLEGRREPGMLDARSAEGWAALRSSVNPQLQKMDRQIAIAEQTLQAIKTGKTEEVFAF